MFSAPPMPPSPPARPVQLFGLDWSSPSYGVVSIFNEIVAIGFLFVAVAIIFFALRRRRKLLTAKDRNAVAVAMLGLMLCSRYASATHNGWELLLVTIIGLAMISMAKNSLRVEPQSKSIVGSI